MNMKRCMFYAVAATMFLTWAESGISMPIGGPSVGADLRLAKLAKKPKDDCQFSCYPPAFVSGKRLVIASTSS
jgi:hypothetical protein